MFMIFTPLEIFYMILMTLVMGFVFSDFFGKFNKSSHSGSHSNKKMYVKQGSRPEVAYDPVKAYTTKKRIGLGPISIDVNWDDMKFAMLIIAPAIILHEFGHKFMAMSFGLEARFGVSLFWLGLAVVLKLFRSPFLFVVPAFVSYPQLASYGQQAAIAIAGPAVNFTLFLGAYALLKFSKNLKPKTVAILALTKQVNLFLALFNMIPIRPFDGGHFFHSLLQWLPTVL